MKFVAIRKLQGLGWPFMVKLHPLPVFVTSLTSSNVVALIFLTICVRDVLSVATTGDNVSAVRLMIETDKRVTYQQIWTSLGIGDKRIITTDRYIKNCLSLVLEQVPEKRPRSEIFLHHDNASPHTTRQIIKYLGTLNIEILVHPPNNSAMPCAFYLFPKIKEKLQEMWFTDTEEAVAPCEKIIEATPKCEWAKYFSQ
ncbi:hypothetical protein EVAR_57774_1 [Eumeta japonica]|uniref:Mariner Mos1 transposase n=1 Tax=Eumeta variegata TaxID=151549 RepID=A0A4C1Y528_EUMVA|nr:hypothetical protein EVAR_57774_1 [Eumeta japonica]